MNDFDPERRATVIAKDVHFVWRTSCRFPWTETPRIMLKKLQKEFAALSPEQRDATIGKLTSDFGATVVKDEAEQAVAVRMKNILVPIV